MKGVIQRIKQASVTVDGTIISQVGQGLCLFLGISKTDQEAQCESFIEKIVGLRLFNDEQGKMNKSITEIQGDLLIVSQFTLYADCTKGQRPSFTAAATYDQAKVVYDFFVKTCRERYSKIAEGQFGAAMDVALINDGPVTLLYED